MFFSEQHSYALLKLIYDILVSLQQNSTAKHFTASDPASCLSLTVAEVVQESLQFQSRDESRKCCYSQEIEISNSRGTKNVYALTREISQKRLCNLACDLSN